MTRKTVDDLKPEYGSVGGAMSQWPRRTLAWICRDLRVDALDEHVAEALIDREIEDLKRLERFANKVGIDPSGLEAKRRALEDSGAIEIVRAIRDRYGAHYSGDLNDCPFEASGLDKACWRCPVPGQTINRLKDDGKTTDERTYDRQRTDPARVADGD